MYIMVGKLKLGIITDLDRVAVRNFLTFLMYYFNIHIPKYYSYELVKVSMSNKKLVTTMKYQ